MDTTRISLKKDPRKSLMWLWVFHHSPVTFNKTLFIQSVKQLANALCQEKLCESSLVRIFWPRERCSLLRDDVVFVDSPGVDVSQNLDDWIDNHCLNADVFVLVLNAESTMTLAVRNFYQTLATDLMIIYFRKNLSSTLCQRKSRNQTFSSLTIVGTRVHQNQSSKSL